jgi:hypothetical protein
LGNPVGHSDRQPIEVRAASRHPGQQDEIVEKCPEKASGNAEKDSNNSRRLQAALGRGPGSGQQVWAVNFEFSAGCRDGSIRIAVLRQVGQGVQLQSVEGADYVGVDEE